jgi:hypothetical protein
MSFSRPNYTIPVTNIRPSKKVSGEFYSQDQIETYMFDEKTKLQSYAALSAAQKSASAASEAVSIRGMVSVPVATNFEDSKKTMNELAGKKGDLAKLKDINICGFLSDIPNLNIDITNFKIGNLPSLNDIMSAVNGITLLALKFPTDIMAEVFGAAGQFVNDISSAIQDAIPTISCKPKESELPTESPEPRIGDQVSFDDPIDIDPFVAEPVPYGKQFNVTIDSPDVTVQSLNDTIDAGEFG